MTPMIFWIAFALAGLAPAGIAGVCLGQQLFDDSDDDPNEMALSLLAGFMFGLLTWMLWPLAVVMFLVRAYFEKKIASRK